MDSSPEISKLESQIQALTDLSTRLQQLRNVPAWLYKSPNSMMPMEPIREQFENLRQLGNNLTSEIVQEALKAARESEEKDKSELTLKYRTDTNKAKYVINSSRGQFIQPAFRLRTPSPDSPRYYESSLTKVSVPFPTLVGESIPLTLAGLPDYIRNFNKASAPSKLNIWVPTRAEMGKLQDPVTVRLLLPDILVAYCALSTPTSRNGLSVETVTVSGPREQVLNASSECVTNADYSFPQTKPHSQSEYTVYQKVSQQIVKMVQTYPQVSFQQLMVGAHGITSPLPLILLPLCAESLVIV